MIRVVPFIIQGQLTLLAIRDYKSSMAYQGTPRRYSKAPGKPRLFKGWRP